MQQGVTPMVDLIIGLFADIADAFLDLWINKVVAKFKRKS